MASTKVVSIACATVLLITGAGWLVQQNNQAQEQLSPQQVRVRDDVNDELLAQFGQGQFINSTLTDESTQTYSVRVLHHQLTQDCVYVLSTTTLTCPVSVYGGSATVPSSAETAPDTSSAQP